MKSWGLAVLGLAVVAFALYRFFPGKSVPDTAPVTVPAVAPPSAVPQPRLHAYQRGPREPLNPAKGEAVSPACTELWTRLRGLDLARTFAFPPKETSLPAGRPCGNPPPELAAAHERYLKSCDGYDGKAPEGMGPGQWANAIAPCYLATQVYRANLTDWLTKDQPLATISDPRVLTDKLIARLERDPALAADVAERLLELEPDLYAAAQTAAFARFLDAQNRAAGIPDDPAWEKQEDAFERARRMSPNDPNLAEMEMVSAMARYRDPDRLRNQAESLRDRFPGTGIGEYFLAYVEYQKGNVEGARRYLLDAQKAGANHPRIQATLDRMKQGNPQPFESKQNFPLNVIAPPPGAG